MDKPSGPFGQGFNNDYEAGAGWRMLESLKELDISKIAVYVARYHAGPKLGVRQFEIYKTLTEKAGKMLRNKLDRLNRNNLLSRSQSQLSILSQTSQEDGEQSESPPKVDHQITETTEVAQG